MIPEAAKRFVEQIGFDEKSKFLLSGCFAHRCHVIHLLRREVQQERIQICTESALTSDKRRFLMKTKQGSKNGRKSRTFTKYICNCLISKEIYNQAGLIVLS